MKTQRYKNSLQILVQSLFEKEQENLSNVSLIGFSGMYILQLKLVMALSELKDLLVSKASSLTEIHHCLYRINQLSRAIYIKKIEIERSKKQLAVYLTELDHNRQARLRADELWEMKTNKHRKESIFHHIVGRSVSLIQSLKARVMKKFDELKKLVISFFSRKKEGNPESKQSFSFGDKAKQGFAVLLKHGKHCRYYCPAFALSRANFHLRRERPAPVYAPSQDLRRNLSLAC